MILDVIKYPNENLYKKSTEVDIQNFTLNDVNFINDMFETMYAHNGIGLAAVQVNVHKRIIIIDLQDDTNLQYVIINPKIKYISQHLNGIEEGCLSIPNINYYINRSEKITIEYYEFDKRLLQSKKNQHQTDHRTDNNPSDSKQQLYTISHPTTTTQHKSLISSEHTPFDSTQAIQNTNQLVRLKKKQLIANDLLSICIQHELDHLNGKLFWDNIQDQLILNELKLKYK